MVTIKNLVSTNFLSKRKPSQLFLAMKSPFICLKNKNKNKNKKTSQVAVFSSE